MARTVLLADDSVTAQNMGRRILMDAGYEVITVNNGSAALKKIHESHPDLIVLDVYMPGYGGLEVCQRLKDAAETARIPVLLSVGKMEPFKTDEAKRVRADGHIVKPFEASELLAALTRLEDRIVPQADASNGRRGKPEKAEKKSRSWHGGDPLAGAEELPTERVAYLAEVKKRRAHSDPDGEDAASDAVNAESALEAASVATPAVAAAPDEEFAVQQVSVPPEGDGPAAPFAALAEPAAAQASSIFDAPTVEIPANHVSAGPAPGSDSFATAANAGNPSVADEWAPAVKPPAAAETEPAGVAAAPVSAARWIAENVALSVEEASVALEAEMQQAQASTRAPEAEAEVAAQEQAAISAETVAFSPEIHSSSGGAAFAAAAGANSETSAVSTQPTAPAPTNSVSLPEVEPNVQPEPLSDATAAWANWQQIRDSVMSPQKAAEIAESMAEIAHAGLPVPEPSAKADAPIADLVAKEDSAPNQNISAGPADIPAEDNSINDIVDSVLADLKPRLMQEIAKKLAAKK